MSSRVHLLRVAPQRGRPWVVCVAALVLVTLLYTSFDKSLAEPLMDPSPDHPPSPARVTDNKLYGKHYQGRSTPSDLNRVTNDTLGFSKVFAIGLPERSDKRDALSLTAALTGFHLDWVDGVRAESIADKAVPYGIDRHGFGSNLGSWRGHMNAIRRIVEEDLESALIMEDDMDWDVRLRSQLEDIAKGARTLLDTSEAGASPSSPYGDGWDVMWIGHCGEPFPEFLTENKDKPADHPGIQYMMKKYAIENDVTVPPPDRTTGMIDFNAYPYTRFVHISAAPICTFAYALSQAGARKVLYELSVNHLTGAFDNALADLCKRSVSSVGVEDSGDDRGLDTKCISVTPPVFFHHRARGRVSGDSDIQNSASGEVREKGMSENIVWSARNNIVNMIMGKTEMESQF